VWIDCVGNTPQQQLTPEAVITNDSFSGHLIDTHERSLDSVPVHCRSKDNINVTINGTLLYRIVYVSTAVYKIDNVMSYICDCVVQSTRHDLRASRAVDLERRHVIERYTQDAATAMCGQRRQDQRLHHTGDAIQRRSDISQREEGEGG
jgi:hypothetical protein